MYTKVRMHIYISLFCQLTVHGGNDTPVVLNTQLLVSSAVLPLKEAELRGIMADSRTGAASIQDEPRASCGARN